MRIRVFQFLEIVLTAVLACGWFYEWMGFMRASISLPGPVYIQVRQALAGTFMKQIPRISIAAVVSQSIATLSARRRRSPSFGLSLLGLVCLVAACISTLRVNVPINRQMDTWSSGALPSNWTELRDRWNRYHTFRTILSMLSFACQVLAALLDKRSA